MEAAGAISVLTVGDPRRVHAGRAVVRTMAACALFVAFAIAAKQIRTLYPASPWQDEPFDAVVSFTIFFVPLMAAFVLVRLPLCRRDEPLPLQRVIDVLRGCRVAVGAILVTLFSDWIAVALRANHAAWSGTTTILIGGLGVLTVIASAVALDVLRASSRLPRTIATDGVAPDWLSDAVAVAERYSPRLGPLRAFVLRVLRPGERDVLDRVRRHPVVTAATLALGFGVALAADRFLFEGFGHLGPAFWLDILVGGSSFFGFIVVAGTYVGLVRTQRPMSVASRRALDPPWQAAPRSGLDSRFGTRCGRFGTAAAPRPGHLAELLGLAGLVTFIAVLGAETLARTHAE